MRERARITLEAEKTEGTSSSLLRASSLPKKSTKTRTLPFKISVGITTSSGATQRLSTEALACLIGYQQPMAINQRRPLLAYFEFLSTQRCFIIFKMMSKRKVSSKGGPKPKAAKAANEVVSRRSRSRTPSKKVAKVEGKKSKEPRSLSYEPKKGTHRSNERKRRSQHNLTVIMPGLSHQRQSSRKRSLSMSTSHTKQKRVRILDEFSSSPEGKRPMMSGERKSS